MERLRQHLPESFRDWRVFLVTAVLAAVGATFAALIALLGVIAFEEKLTDLEGRFAAPGRWADWAFGWGGSADNPAARLRLRAFLADPYWALFGLSFITLWMSQAERARRLVDRFDPPFPDWLDPKPIHLGADDPAAPRFVGRKAELALLERMDSPANVWCAVHGLAGSGKTRLALEWALRGQGQRWLIAGNRHYLGGKLLSGDLAPQIAWHRRLGAWARLHLPGIAGAPRPSDPWDIGHVKPAHLDGTGWASLRSRRQSIVIIDRPDTLQLPALLRALADHKPDPNRSVTVLLIDALPPRHRSVPVAHSVHCPPLSREEVIDFLAAAGLRSDQAVTEQLYRESGGMPLVLGWLVAAQRDRRPLHEITGGAVLESHARDWITAIHDVQQNGARCSLALLATAELLDGLSWDATMPDQRDTDFQNGPSPSDIRRLLSLADTVEVNALPAHPVPLVGLAVLALALAEVRPSPAQRLGKRGWVAAPDATARTLLEFWANRAILAAMPTLAAQGESGLCMALHALLSPDGQAPPDTALHAWADASIGLWQAGLRDPDPLAPLQAAADVMAEHSGRQGVALRALAGVADAHTPPDATMRAFLGARLVALSARPLDAPDAAVAARLRVRLAALAANEASDPAHQAAAMQAVSEALALVPATAGDAYAQALADACGAHAVMAAATAVQDGTVARSLLERATSLCGQLELAATQPDASPVVREQHAIAIQSTAYGCARVAADAAGLAGHERRALLAKAFAARRSLAQLAARTDATLAIREQHGFAIHTTAYGCAGVAADPAAGLAGHERRALLAKAFAARRSLARLAAQPDATVAIRERHATAIQSTAYGCARVAADAAGLAGHERRALLAKAFAARRSLAQLAARTDATLAIREQHGFAIHTTAYGCAGVAADPAAGLAGHERRALLAKAFAARRSLARLAAQPDATVAIRERHATAIQSTAYGCAGVAADPAAGLAGHERRALLAKAFAARRSLARLAAQPDATVAIREQHAFAIQNTAYGCAGVAADPAAGLAGHERRALLAKAFAARRSLARLAAQPDATVAIREQHAFAIQNTAYGCARVAADPAAGLAGHERRALLAKAFAARRSLARLAARPDATVAIRESHAIAIQTTAYGCARVAADPAAGLAGHERRALLAKAFAAQRSLAQLAAQPDATVAIREQHAFAIQNTAYGCAGVAADPAAGLAGHERRALLAKAFAAQRSLAQLAARTDATLAIREQHAIAIQTTAYGCARVAADPAAGLAGHERRALLAKAFAAQRSLAQLAARTDATLAIREQHAIAIQNTAYGCACVAEDAAGLARHERLAVLERARAAVVALDNTLANARWLSAEPQLDCLMHALASVGSGYFSVGDEATDRYCARRIAEIASRPGFPNLPRLRDQLIRPPRPTPKTQFDDPANGNGVAVPNGPRDTPANPSVDRPA